MDTHTKMAVLAVVRSVSANYEEFTLSTSVDDETSSVEEMQQRPRKKRTAAQISRIQSFVEYMAPKFTDTEFQSHFHLSVNAIAPKLISKYISGCQSTCPRKQLLSVLWLFATSDSF